MYDPTSEALENLPSVHLRHHDSDMGIIRGKVNPKLRGQRIPSQFQIVPLLDKNGRLDPSIGIVHTRDELLRLLRTKWEYVAIRCEEGKFLSCRKATYLPTVGWSSLTEYRNKIGEYEVFQVQYHPGSGCYSFISHNGLYMNANETMKTVAFRDAPRSPGKTIASHRSWSIYPLLSRSTDEERVVFVGVVDNEEGQFQMKLKAEGVNLSEDYLADMKDYFINTLKCGESTHIQGQSNGLYHNCVRGEDGTAYIVIVSTLFSRALAAECVGDLADIFDKYRDNKEDAQLEQRGIKKDEIIRKELEFLMWEFDELNERKLQSELKPILEKMEENIERLLQNIDSLEHIEATSKEALELSKEFRKNTKKAKDRMMNTWAICTFGILGGISGGVGGFLLGGPTAAAIFAEQGVEITIFAVTGLFGGAALGRAQENNRMWHNYKAVETLL